VPVFVQDPGKYLKELGARLECPVAPGRPAVLDAAHAARVNHETYYFSSPAARDRFRRDPLRYCGQVTDPVSGERFRPTVASPRAVHLGRPYYFRSAENRARFQREPRRFAEPTRAHEQGTRAAAPPELPAGDPRRPRTFGAGASRARSSCGRSCGA
jgi:YHS domain-containing protein